MISYIPLCIDVTLHSINMQVYPWIDLTSLFDVISFGVLE